jgi:hypothetical protein
MVPGIKPNETKGNDEPVSTTPKPSDTRYKDDDDADDHEERPYSPQKTQALLIRAKSGIDAAGSVPPSGFPPVSFHRRAGPCEHFLNSAVQSCDMLVWQTASNRSEPLPVVNTSLPCRPRSEWYDKRYGAQAPLETTARHSQSPKLKLRHQMAQTRRLALEVADPRYVGTLQRPHTVAATASTRAARITKEASQTHLKLLRFERSNHQKMNFTDFTKDELIELIELEGLPVPGEKKWDNRSGKMMRETCEKSVYVNYVKTSFFGAEPRPLVRVGKRLKVREEYCIVDIFEGSQGSIRVRAYDDRTSREYRKFS